MCAGHHTYNGCFPRERSFNILSYFQDSRSIGAIAGLALAVFFTWRLLTLPSGTQRRQHKSSAGATSSGSSTCTTADVTCSKVSTSSEYSGSQNAVKELFQPVKVFFLLSAVFPVLQMVHVLIKFILCVCSQL